MRRFLFRLRAVVVRLRHGLPLRGGLSGVIRTDQYVSHVSIHCAAARFADGAHVLEVGARGGDGLAELAQNGQPASLRGYESDLRLVAAGRRRFGLDLRLTSLDALPAADAPADLLLAVNIVQQIEDADATLDWMATHRRPGARVVVSVPPIVDETTMAIHRAFPRCRTHRFVWEWEAALRQRFERLAIFRHLPPEGAALDLSSAEPSRWAPEEFRFEEISPAELDELAGLSIVFLAEDGS